MINTGPCRRDALPLRAVYSPVFCRGCTLISICILALAWRVGHVLLYVRASELNTVFFSLIITNDANDISNASRSAPSPHCKSEIHSPPPPTLPSLPQTIPRFQPSWWA